MTMRATAAIATLMVLMGTNPASTQTTAATREQRAAADRIIARWAERPRLGAVEMIAKYGAPQEATAERLIWHNAGPFKRITVMNVEIPHDFPLPHVDFMEHTITYNVPLDKVGPLIEFDGSSTINRTVGELSARCDLEGHNILTLNLDHDIVTGKKTVQEARTAFGEIVGQDLMGKRPPYVEALQFEPARMADAAFSDAPVIPGAPLRAAEVGPTVAVGGMAMTDAEILATVIAIDLNEVLAAAEARKETMGEPALAYAKMLHEAHGMSMDQTMKLGQQIGVRPIITPDVESMQKKGAAELARLVPLNGKAFERAYLTAMIEGHTEALSMIDNRLLRAARNDAVKQHLTKARGHVADHLQRAKMLRGASR